MIHGTKTTEGTSAMWRGAALGIAMASLLLSGCGGGAVSLIDSGAPAVSLISPLAGSTIGGSFTAELQVTDGVGVASVRFRFGGSLVGTLTAPPWQLLIDSSTVPDGVAALEVQAFDTSGNVTTASWTFTVDNTTGPSFSAWTVADDAWVSGTVGYGGQLAAPSGLDRLEFSVDGTGATTTVLSGTSTPFSLSLPTTSWSDGSHSLRFTAWDRAGHSLTVTRSLRVDNEAPVLTVTAPASDGLVRDMVPLAATATDGGGSTLTLFEATMDGMPVAMTNGGGDDWLGSWDSRSTADLTEVTFQVIVQDGAGNQASSSRTLTVYNSTQDTATAGIPSLSGSSLPRSVAAGDLSGSSDGDVLVANDFGVIYLFEGSSSFGSADVSAADRVIDGSSLGGFATSMLVKDLDGDGTAELVVGAPLTDGPAGSRTDCGSVYVFDRATIDGATGPLGPGDARCVIHGSAANRGLGQSLDRGSFFGDGRYYLAMGAPSTDFAAPGELAFVAVAALTPAAIIDTAGSFDGRLITGASSGDAFGSSLRAFWNTAQVGVPTEHCLAVGASRVSTNGLSFNGAVHVLFPPLIAATSIGTVPTGQRIMVAGEGSNDYLGTQLAPFLEDSGTGIETVLVGVPSASPGGRLQAGSVYLLDISYLVGQLNDPPPTLSAHGAQYLQIDGAAAGDRCGSAVTAGNFQGDGSWELVCGGTGVNWPVGSTSERSDCGAVYIVELPITPVTGGTAVDLNGPDSYAQRIVGPANSAMLGSHLEAFIPSPAAGIFLLMGAPGVERLYVR